MLNVLIGILSNWWFY